MLKKKDFDDDYKRLYPGEAWMMRLYKYGQVSRQWKRVILQSSKLFDEEEKRLMEINEVSDTDGSQLRQMIKEGYMERASTLQLCLHEGMQNDMETLCTIRDAAEKCSIEAYDFCAYGGNSDRRTRSMTQETAEHLKCIIDILKLSKKCKKVEIEIGSTYNQRDAENVIDFLLALVQIETLTSIKLDIWYDASHDLKKIRGRTYLVSDHINWDFIKRRHFGDTKIDHIKKVSVRKIIRHRLLEYYSDIVYDRSNALTLSDFISKVQGNF